MTKGQLFILSGPSGVGKDSVMSGFFEKNPDVKLSISATSRPKRCEDDEQKYRMISKEEFEKGIQNGDFLEHACYCGNYYGTPKAPIENWLNSGSDVIVEIEIQGAKKLMEVCPEAVSIFILPPDFETLRKRLEKRCTEHPEKLAERVNKAKEEIAFSINYDYVIINDRLEDAVDLLDSIFRAEHSRTTNNTDFIKGVLKNA